MKEAIARWIGYSIIIIVITLGLAESSINKDKSQFASHTIGLSASVELMLKIETKKRSYEE